MRVIILPLILASIFSFHIPTISAHEIYVLSSEQWENGFNETRVEPFESLLDTHNLLLTVIIALGIILVLILNLRFRLTTLGSDLHKKIESLSVFGPLVVRITFAAAFFFSALNWSFLGPELSLHDMPYAVVLRIAIFIISFLILVGLHTEYAALAAGILFTFAFFKYGTYLITYFSYLGEIIVLILFGARKYSLDRLRLGTLNRLTQLKQYETTIVRIFYGLALIYAAVTIKLLHPNIVLEVVNTYHLTRFHWLFPSDPLLIALGAALAEITIGLFILLGFEMRLTVLVSLFYITLSLFFFGEEVWPHLILYGISLNLLIEPEVFTLDHFINRKLLTRHIFKGLLTHGKKDLNHPIHQ